MLIADGAAADRARVDAAKIAEAGDRVGKARPFFSYCASCGSWDAHGPACLRCGYDFVEPAAILDPER